MANDPTVTPDQAAQQATTAGLTASGNAAAEAAPKLDTYAQSGDKVNTLLQKIAQYAPAAVAGLLSTGKATDAFVTGLAPTRFSGFANQLEEIGQAAERPGVALTALKDAGSGLIGMLGKLGGGSAEASSLVSRLSAAIASGSTDIKGAIKATTDYLKNVVSLGDELPKTRAALIQQAAAAGDLDRLLQQAGGQMQDFDEIAIRQQKTFKDMARAMGESPAQIAAFSSALNKVPGVISTMTSSMEGSEKSNKLLQDSIALFKISGRDYAAITKDMSDAVMGFGVNEEHALEYTTRMSTAAKMLKIPVDELHRAVTSSANAFKAFVTSEESGHQMTKNLEASMSGYINMLRNAHVPMSVATDMAGEFASRIGDMSIAQKAFVSAQSGGPGGLMGAFQLDRLMDEGKIDQVMERVQGVLRKQFGRIVTTAQAAQSQYAAEQMTRQIMILRQGPLGQFVKSDAEARRMLDAMATPGSKADMKAMTDKVKEETPLQDFLEKGNMIARGSQGIFSEILSTLQGGELVAAQQAARVMEPTLGSQTFYRRSPGEMGGITPEVLEARRAKATGAVTGGTDRGATLMAQAMTDLKDLPASLKGAMNALVNAFKTGNEDSVEAANAKLSSSIEVYRKMAAQGPANQQKAVEQNIEAIKKASAAGIQSFMSSSPGVTPATTEPATTPPPTGRPTPTLPAPAPAATGATPRAAARIPDIRRTADYAPAGQRLPAPVAPPPQTGAQGTAAVTTGHIGAPGQPIPVKLSPDSSITVHFTGTCPHCKTNIDVTQVGKTPSTPATVPR